MKTSDRIKSNNGFAFHLLFIFTIVIFSLLGPRIGFLKIDPDGIDLANRFLGPSFSHIMGTDDLGRDILSRVIYGGRVSVLFGLVLTAFSMAFGVLLGLISGYYGKWLDFIVMRITEALFVLPILPVMIVFSAVDLKSLIGTESLFQTDPSTIKIFLVILLFSWMSVTRVTRCRVIEIKRSEYITAIKSQGGGSLRIIFRHIVPNSLKPIMSTAAVTFSSTIMYESTLSFLGLGIRPPTPSWGNMLSNAIEFVGYSPYLAIFPGAMIFLSVWSLGQISSHLSD